MSRTPVAWLHEHHRDAYVITNRVKNIWLDCDPRHVEHYTIPLYADEPSTWTCEECGNVSHSYSDHTMHICEWAA